MPSRIYDTSAMLRFANNEKGSGRVEILLNESAKSPVKDKASALSASEFIFSLRRKSGKSPAGALAIFGAILEFLPADLETTQKAAFLKLKYQELNLSMADAMILQMGIANDFEIITCDKEWLGVKEAKVKIV